MNKLSRLRRLSKLLLENWPWMTAQDNIYVESPIYDFGDSFDDVLKKTRNLSLISSFGQKKNLQKVSIGRA